jgi:hypothetical protein
VCHQGRRRLQRRIALPAFQLGQRCLRYRRTWPPPQSWPTRSRGRPMSSSSPTSYAS